MGENPSFTVVGDRMTLLIRLAECPCGYQRTVIEPAHHRHRLCHTSSMSKGIRRQVRAASLLSLGICCSTLAPVPHLYRLYGRFLRHQRIYELGSPHHLPRCLYSYLSSSKKLIINLLAVIWSIGGFVVVSITLLACVSPDYNSA